MGVPRPRHCIPGWDAVSWSWSCTYCLGPITVCIYLHDDNEEKLYTVVGCGRKLSTALIQRGSLKKGSILVAGTAWAKVITLLTVLFSELKRYIE